MEQATFNGPEEEILGYMNSTFTREYASVLATSLAILYSLQEPTIQENLVSIINGPESEDDDGLRLAVESAVVTAIDSVLSSFGIELNDDTSLRLKNAIITSLQVVTTVENTLPYIRLLETWGTPSEKIAKIVGDFTTFDETEVMMAISQVEEGLVSRLLVALEAANSSKESSNDETEKAQLENFQKFCQYAGKETVGYRMVNGELRFGMEMATYMPFMAKAFEEAEDSNLAKDLVSFFFVCSDTWKSPVNAFRLHSEMLLKNVKNFQVVETGMRSIINGFEQFKGSLNEQV